MNIYTYTQLPGMIGSMAGFQPAGYGNVNPADAFFLDLDTDFPNEDGPNPLEHGDGTLYQLATPNRSGALDRAWKLHAWPTLQISGTISVASQMFVGEVGSVAAAYRTNPTPAGPPVGGLAKFAISQTVSLTDTPHTIGAEKWAQFHRQTFGGRAIHYGTWPGQNHAGNIPTQALLEGDYDLDWILATMPPPSGPIAPPPSSPSGYGDEICRVAAGNYNLYLGSEVALWDGDPSDIPSAHSVPFSLVVRGSAFANCGCTRYRDPISGAWQYPILFYLMLSASIEADTLPGTGYYGSPPISPDTDGFRANESGLLKCCTILSPPPPVGTFHSSGVRARINLPNGSFMGDIDTHNYSESFVPDPTAGDNGWSTNSIPWQSHADLILHFQDPIRWEAPPEFQEHG